MSISAGCKDNMIKKLKCQEVESWRSSFFDFINKINHMTEFCVQTIKNSNAPLVNIETAKELMPLLEKLQQTSPEEINESEIEGLLNVIQNAQKILKAKEPKIDVSGSFFNTLHSFKNIPQVLNIHAIYIRKNIDECILILRKAGSREPILELLRELEKHQEELKSGINLSKLSNLELTLNKWQSHVPSVLEIQPTNLPSYSINRENIPINKIIIVEDQNVWLEPIKAAIIDILPDFHDKISCYKTYDEAKQAFSDLKTGKEIRGQTKLTHGEFEQERKIYKQGVLAILDLGLPRNDMELKAGKSNRVLGKELLMEIRSYALNIRTILLTSHFDFLDDHRWAINKGIEPEDYIWKAEKNYKEHLQDCIKRIIEQEKYIEEIELFEDTGIMVIIDGIEVSFKKPMYYKTFSILCDNRLSYLTCEDIVNKLDEKYTADGLYKDYDPKKIPDHIYGIRKDIQEAFSRAGRTIYPERVVNTKLGFDNKVRYHIQQPVRVKSSEAPPTATMTGIVLVVENDLEGWAKPIAAFLEDLNHVVEIATNVEEAIDKARIEPAIICLDMHLPKNREEFERNPFSGQAEAGLEVLKIIRKEICEDILAVALTSLYELEELRSNAIRQGIDINHWIAKDSDWKSNLGYAIWRLLKEFNYGIKTPIDKEGFKTHIRLQRSDTKNIWIDGIKIVLTESRRKLIWTLAERANLPIPRTELINAVYDKNKRKEQKDPEVAFKSAFKSLIDDTRKDIIKKSGIKINGKELIAETEEGYMLCALVTIQED